MLGIFSNTPSMFKTQIMSCEWATVLSEEKVKRKEEKNGTPFSFSRQKY